MNRFAILSLVVLLAAMSFAFDAQSQCDGVTINFTPPAGVALICPAGDAGPFAGFGVKVVDTLNNPIVGIPRCDFWVIDCDPANDMVLCSGAASSYALFDTDATGTTRFNGPISGGGCATGLALVIQGLVVQDPASGCTSEYCMPYRIRSPDINGSLMVDLIDVSLFAPAWPPGGYLPCADFDNDGAVGLVDLSILAQHFGHDCVVFCP